jgi:malonyl-CoA decarboxylase
LYTIYLLLNASPIIETSSSCVNATSRSIFLPSRSPVNVGFLQELLQSMVARGRDYVGKDLIGKSLLGRALGNGIQYFAPKEDILSLLKNLVSGRGEASGVAMAYEIIKRYQGLSDNEKTEFLIALNSQFSADPEAIRHAFRAFDQQPSAATLQSLTEAVEPPRQEVIRRLNQAPGNTLELVRMREDLLSRLKENPDLVALDADFIHLFSSWFNRGFLVIRRIDWTTPAYILEKIIRYEAVHAIESWDDLRRRIEPPDRRCFAFFHPALGDEPLIFVEVALTKSIPTAIGPILAEKRPLVSAVEATTAVFYSISNCQKGLAKISFGHFLIKQVAEELKREMPNLTTFVTLSPVPGFRRWIENEASQSMLPFEERAAVDVFKQSDANQHSFNHTRPELNHLLAVYMLKAKDKTGQPFDPVARFHLGNGARLEKLNLAGDLSKKGLAESYGVMVNYLYDLSLVEQNHERYAANNEVVASPDILRTFSKA